MPFSHAPLRPALSSEALPKIRQANFQALHNMSWALATLDMVDNPLLAAIASSAIAIISAFDICKVSFPELFDFVFTLPGLAWSYVNLHVGGSVSGLLPLVCGRLLAAGREVDGRLLDGSSKVLSDMRTPGPW